MKNTKELRDELVNVFSGVRDGSIDVGTGKTLVATSNAILKSVQLELEQNKLIGAKKKIKFLE